MFPAMPDFLDERGGKYFYDTRVSLEKLPTDEV